MGIVFVQLRCVGNYVIPGQTPHGSASYILQAQDVERGLKNVDFKKSRNEGGEVVEWSKVSSH